MDPLTSLGLAANILQFLEVGYKVLTSAAEISSSVSGTTTENEHLLVTVSRLEQVLSALSCSEQSNDDHDDHVAIRGLAVKCQPLAEKLLQMSRFLTTVDGGSGSAHASSIRISWRAWRSRDEISSIRTTLNEYRTQTLLEISLLLQKDQSFVKTGVLGLVESVDRLHDDIRTMAERVNIARDGGVENLQGLCQDLLGFSDRVRDTDRRSSILQILRPDAMDSRFEAIKGEHARTFEWVFQDDQCFLNWIRSGTGIFHIEGKAGSGKSTLMKFLRLHSRTEQELQLWSGDRSIIIGHFFFWRAGTQMQRSVKGLARSLLYLILEQAPELIESAFPQAWERLRSNPLNGTGHVQITSINVQDAFSILIHEDSLYESRKFCFFIDGLDEYDESNGLDPESQSCYTDLIRLLEDWAHRRPEVKICVSSRDWYLFRKAFSPQQKLRLEDLTRRDMEIIVTDSLKGFGQDFKLLGPTDGAFASLVTRIVDKAEGVFLWVVLVLKSLRQGLQHQDSPHTLELRLESIPPGLENFLSYTLDSVDVIYQPLSARIFAVLLEVSRIDIDPQMPLLQYSFLEDLMNDRRFALDMKNPMDDKAVDRRHRRMLSQLDACCRGLVEVRRSSFLHGNDSMGLGLTVSFSHRSVRDFLEDQIHHDGRATASNNVARLARDLDLDHVHALMSHSFLAHVVAKMTTRQTSDGVEAPDSVEVDKVSRLLRAAVHVIHRRWLGSGTLDVELVVALDRSLTRGWPQKDGDGVSGIRLDEGSVVRRERRGNQGFEYLDFIGTYIVQGFEEILTWARDAAKQGKIRSRSDWTLFVFVFEGLLKSDESAGPAYISMARKLLQFGVRPNERCGSCPSATPWLYFVRRIIEEEPFVLKIIAWNMIRLLLEHGANPYIWIDSPEGPNNFHVLVCRHVVLTSATDAPPAQSNPSSVQSNLEIEVPPVSEPPISLRQVVEFCTPEGKDAILAMLPSHEDYARQWKEAPFLFSALGLKMVMEAAAAGSGYTNELCASAIPREVYEQFVDIWPGTGGLSESSLGEVSHVGSSFKIGQESRSKQPVSRTTALGVKVSLRARPFFTLVLGSIMVLVISHSLISRA